MDAPPEPRKDEGRDGKNSLAYTRRGKRLQTAVFLEGTPEIFAEASFQKSSEQS